MNLEKHVFPEALYSGEYYTGNGYFVLILEGVVELVEVSVQIEASVLNQCKALKCYKSSSGDKLTKVFNHWAVDINKNMVIKKTNRSTSVCIFFLSAESAK